MNPKAVQYRADVAGKVQRPAAGESLLLEGGVPFVLLKPSMDWMRPTHIKESNLLSPKSSNFIYLFIWLRWVFVATRGLSLVAASGGYSLLQCTGFSLRWLLCCGAQALGVWASVVVACRLSSCGWRALEHRLSSCCAWA